MSRLGKLAATRLRSERGQPVEPSPSGMSYADPETGQWYGLTQADLEQAQPEQSLDERLMGRELPGAREPRGVFTDPETGEKRYVVGQASGGMPVTESTTPEQLAQYEAKARSQSANMRSARAERQQQAEAKRQERINYYKQNFPGWYAQTQQPTQAQQGATQDTASNSVPTQAQQEQQTKDTGPGFLNQAAGWFDQNVVTPVRDAFSQNQSAQQPQPAQPQMAFQPSGGHAAGGYQGQAVGANLPSAGNIKQGIAMKTTVAVLKRAADANSSSSDGYTSQGITRNVGEHTPGTGYPVQQEKPENQSAAVNAVGKGLTRASTNSTPPLSSSGVAHGVEKTAQALGEVLFQKRKTTPKSMLQKALKNLRPEERK